MGFFLPFSPTNYRGADQVSDITTHSKQVYTAAANGAEFHDVNERILEKHRSQTGFLHTFVALRISSQSAGRSSNAPGMFYGISQPGSGKPWVSSAIGVHRIAPSVPPSRKPWEQH